MVYSVYFSKAGVPQAGLTPVWLTLQDAITTVSVLSPPAITEIGGGFYKFSITPADPLVGVIDGGSSLTDPDRYKPVQIQTSAATAFGSVQITLQINDPLALVAIPDVELVILNQDGTLLVNSALSNSMGQMVAQLNPGIYILRMRKDGYSFTTPQNFTVTGPAPQTFTFNGTSIGTPAADSATIVVPFNPNLQLEP